VEQTGGRFINKSSLRELQQFVQGFPDSIEKTLELSTSAAPQIEVVGRAIKAAKRKNIFMVCEAGIDPDHLLKKVIQNQDNPRKMTKVKKEIVSTGAYSGDLASRLNDIFRGDNNLEGDFSYINFLAFNKDQTLEILSILKPVLSKNDRHFIFAMGEDLFDRAMDTLQSDELFRVIWMHVLSESQTIPYQV